MAKQKRAQFAVWEPNLRFGVELRHGGQANAAMKDRNADQAAAASTTHQRSAGPSRPMNFSDYLAKRRVQNNPGGAFILDARKDPKRAHIESGPALQAHLMRRHGAYAKGAIEAAEPVWKGYRAYVLKNRRS